MTNYAVSTEYALFEAMEQAAEGDSITVKPGHLMDYEVTTSTEAEFIITGGVHVAGCAAQVSDPPRQLNVQRVGAPG